MSSDITSFLDHFTDLKDPRSQKNRLYTMSEILLVAFCATICGAEGWQDLEDFGHAKLDFLRQHLPFENGIPSDDTFRRFFRSLDPDAFQALFRKWVKSLQQNIGRVIAIDGKSSRRSFDGEIKMLHMVSAFATEARLVLGQEKVDEKSNEITAIPRLLEWLDLKGATITIDAMGCQHKIANMILSKAGAYIFALKGNQGNLHEDVRVYFEDKSLASKLPIHQTTEKGHGRIETRKCWIETDVQWLIDRHSQWRSVGSIIKIASEREIKGKSSSEIRYYIASKALPAQQALQIIRSHWAIENSLHWVLDMSFGEDQSRIRKKNAPQVMAVMRHIALNMLQCKKQSMIRQSIRRLRKIAAWDHSMLESILTQNFS